MYSNSCDSQNMRSYSAVALSSLTPTDFRLWRQSSASGHFVSFWEKSASDWQKSAASNHQCPKP